MVVESLAQDIAVSHVENILEADQLLREIAGANRQPTYAETVFFTRECGWSDVTIREQLRRMTNVLRLESIAGSPADREAAGIEATTAASVLGKESPKIIDQIEKLQSKLNGLERDARLSAKRVTEQSEAVQQLRGLCPEHVFKSVNAKRNLLDQTLMRSILDIETRINEIECCLAPSKYPTEAAYLESLERSFPGAVNRTNHGQMFRRQLTAQWPSIRAEIENELAELQAKIEPLQTQYDTELARIEKPLSYYGNQGESNAN
jgi:hypothetical protein